MTMIDYDREKAVAYAHQWAHGRNPRYYNFAGLGGDCANFASQCIYEGVGVMNYKPLFGWYYNSPDDRTPSWSGVESLCNFLLGNRGAGPYATEIDLARIEVGDLIQIASWKPDFHHTLVVVAAGSSPEDVLIAAHSYDSDNRPLASYGANKMRCLHIAGGRK